jgi:hypothetical protein
MMIPPADVGRPRRRGDRTTPLFVAAAYDRLWHEAAVCRGQNHDRFLGYSGREMLAERLSQFGPNCDIGWIEMPQRGSLLPYRGVLSFLSKAREASSSEAARVHHAARRRGGVAF